MIPRPHIPLTIPLLPARVDALVQLNSMDVARIALVSGRRRFAYVRAAIQPKDLLRIDVRNGFFYAFDVEGATSSSWLASIIGLGGIIWKLRQTMGQNKLSGGNMTVIFYSLLQTSLLQMRL